MTPQEFISKWQRANLSERSACQQHFLDLCDLLNQPKPAAADPDGAWYCFERGVSKTEGGNGWADVWMRGHFGWEYKGKHKDLKAAYGQLLQYRESLENPPLLVVCDLDRFEIHTNFTGTAKHVHTFDLSGLADPKNLDILRRLFSSPESLKPGQTTQSVTEEVTKHFGTLADGMRARGVPAHDAAHFLMKLMFCMFAEDIDLLRGQIFSRALAGARYNPSRLTKVLSSLFDAMAHGGMFGPDDILHFNGGLFADGDVIELTSAEIEVLHAAAEPDWSVVEPHIFGTLFERTMDPAKRAQIGAHYTSSEDIQTLLLPVMMAPLRREWAVVRSECESILPRLSKDARREHKPRRTESIHRKKINKLILEFIERLENITVLDPACGSGNFLYIAIRMLLDLEKEVITFAASIGTTVLPQVRPTQLRGIEINPYAAEIAQVVIWIGYLQWMRDNGFRPPSNPVLEPFESIENKDAILDLSNPENPAEPDWPKADFIVGNPPFLGDKMMRRELGDSYVSALRRLFSKRIPGQSDLCCYWFEKSRQLVESGNANRVGLLATQGIRGGANRKVLDRIRESGDIFFAESDRDWVLDGAHVHVSMVGFDNGTESVRHLDGRPAPIITSSLTSTFDPSLIKSLRENAGFSFIGTTKGGAFDITESKAIALLTAGGNPNGLPNSDVLRPIVNAKDIAQRLPQRWLIDNEARSQEAASMYEAPHAQVVQRVQPVRSNNRNAWLRKHWWRLQRMRGEMRSAISPLNRFIVTPRVSKHRIFVWINWPVVADDSTVVFASSDDAVFGVLHSRIHQVWVLAPGMGTQVRERKSGFRYTPSTCTDSFPGPNLQGDHKLSISSAAQELDRIRNEWLNPPDWVRVEHLEFSASTSGPWGRFIRDVNEKGLGVVRYPRLVPLNSACERELQKRTLTNLYNDRPEWLDLAHKRLDAAVLAAYGWSSDLTDDELLANLFSLNLERASRQKEQT